RISRPPVGVCCDRVRFDCMGLDSGPRLTPADLDAFENEHGITLPIQHRAFLLNQNGGYPYPNRVRVAGMEPDDWPQLEAFEMFGPIGWEFDEEARIPTPIRGVADDPFGERGRLLSVADYNGGEQVFCVGLDGVNAGRVFYHTDPVHAWDEFPVTEVVGSLAELLDRLDTPDPVWAQAIVRDDRPALTAWLDAGGDPNAAIPRDEWNLLEHAAQWGRREIVMNLLARGAVVTATAWEAANFGKDAEIKTMIMSACPKKPSRKTR
ncbi:MAG: SMI1/KNR4 family protein, partial [Fimbriiglobus sp.]